MKKIGLILSSLALLSACSQNPPSPSGSDVSSISSESSVDTYQVKWASPTGAPTLAFVTEGANTNWISSSNPATDVLPHFADNNYDALVFDGTQGLNNIKANNRNYKLAKWIGEGTFYVVSVLHDDQYVPESQPTVYGFMPSGNVSLAFRDLAANSWNWGTYSETTDSKITYGAAVSNVQQVLNAMAEAGTVEGCEYDYFVLAQPAYAAMKAKFAKKNLPFYLVKDMQSDFAAAHDGAKIPAAAIFVNNSSYANHKASIDAWLSKVDNNLETVSNNLVSAKDAVAAYDNEDGTNARFGFSSTALAVVKAQAGSETNPMHLLSNSKYSGTKASLANGFQTALGKAEFSSDYFLD